MAEERQFRASDLEYVEQLRYQGRFDEAEEFLNAFKRTNEVITQLRKVAIARVLFAAQGADTTSVRAALDRFKQQLRAYQSQQRDVDDPDLEGPGT
jgi:hypothetical protein